MSEHAYRTKIGFTIFLCSGALALIVALLTIGHQSIREAEADQIIAKCAKAMEISTKLSSLKTIRLTIPMNRPGESMMVDLMRPNRIRKEWGATVLVFDGRRADSS